MSKQAPGRKVAFIQEQRSHTLMLLIEERYPPVKVIIADSSPPIVLGNHLHADFTPLIVLIDR